MMKQGLDVSVVIATYNHGPYVEAAIHSVLAQRGISFEVLIADDGSRDDTPERVKRIQDPRVSFVAHSINRGACVVTNELISKSRGQYIAVMNSDDIWLSSGKIEAQLEFMEAHPEMGATFGRVDFIDSNGERIEKNDLSFGRVFDQPNRSQGSWLRRFFYEGNCLCHPSVLIRRSCYSELGLLDNRLRQLPDFDMWIRLVKAYPINISQDSLVGFRILPGENASAQTKGNAIRTTNEHFLIALKFFEGFSPELMRAAFGDELTNKSCPSANHVKIEAALLLLQSDMLGLGPAYQIIGLMKIHDMLGDGDARDVLYNEYGIDDRWLQQKLGDYKYFRPEFVIGDASREVQPLIKSKGSRSKVLKWLRRHK